MKQLLTIVPVIAMDWFEVAVYLNFSIYRIRIIKEKYRDNCLECCHHLLEEWIGTDQGVTPKNWVTLLSVLRDNLGIVDYCNHIEEHLKW